LPARPSREAPDLGRRPVLMMAEQRIVPMIGYEDASAAIDFLSTAFGFEEDRSQRHESNGIVSHAELTVGGDARVMVATPSSDYVSPKRLRVESETARRMYDNPSVIHGHLVVGGDLQAHCARARAAGAPIIREPDDPGVGFLVYTAEDPE